VTLAALAEAYARRVQFEAKVHAAETIRALAAAMGGGESTPRQQPRVSADQLLGQMGVGF
jgi:hypothetical protein